MTLPGERLLIAAMLDDVQTGEDFDRIPPHMTEVRWFNLQENRRFRLFAAMDKLFADQPVSVLNESEKEPITVGVLNLFGKGFDRFLVRELEGVYTGHNFALHALVKSLGTFDDKDPFKDTFQPHITRTKGLTLRRDEPVLFSSVALISAQEDIPGFRVLENYPLAQES